MLYETLKYIKNFFPAEGQRKEGKITIENSTVTLDFLKSGQYFLIEGSVFNDGVYIYPCNRLRSETFEGCITGLCIPREVVCMADDITEWCEKHKDSLESPFTSESFGGYSYSKSTNTDGSSVSWQDVFKRRLNVWRKR